MIKDAETIYIGIRDTDKLVHTGNNNSLLELAIKGTAQAKLLAPVDLGQLRNSIQYRTGAGKTGGATELENELPTAQKDTALVGTPVEYGVYQEFGTRNVAPQPYLRPSIAILAGESPAVVKAKTNEEFEKGPLKYGVERVKF